MRSPEGATPSWKIQKATAEPETMTSDRSWVVEYANANAMSCKATLKIPEAAERDRKLAYDQRPACHPVTCVVRVVRASLYNKLCTIYRKVGTGIVVYERRLAPNGCLQMQRQLVFHATCFARLLTSAYCKKSMVHVAVCSRRQCVLPPARERVGDSVCQLISCLLLIIGDELLASLDRWARTQAGI